MLGVWRLIARNRGHEAPRLDWLGPVLALAGVSGLVYGIIEEPVRSRSDTRLLAA